MQAGGRPALAAAGHGAAGEAGSIDQLAMSAVSEARIAPVLSVIHLLADAGVDVSRLARVSNQGLSVDVS